MSNARKLADNLPSIGQLAGRNLVINGNMTVAQRTTGISGETAGGYKTVDRMYTNASGATYNQSQETVTVGGETGLPTQFTKYLRHNVTTGNNWSQIYHKIEDVSLVPEGTATLSFYAKGTSPNAGLTFYAWQNFGSGGSGEVGISSITQTVTLTSTWQRFIVPITIPSMAGKTMGTGSHFYFGIGQGGSTSTNAWTLDITGLQLEIGSEVTPFEHDQDYGVTLAKCQRYTYVIGDTSNVIYLGGGSMYTTTAINISIPLPVQLRASPSLTAVANGTGNWLNTYVGATGTTSNATPQAGDNTQANIRVYCTSAHSGSSPAAAGAAIWCMVLAGAKLIVDAEL